MGVLRRPGNPALVILAVGVILVADWTENLLQLSQLNQFVASEKLNSGLIRSASVATIVKLWSICIACVLLLLGFGWVACRAINGDQFGLE